MASVPLLTSDNMRKVVEEEGLEARNLLNWNVIVSDKSSLEVPKTAKKPPTSPRPQSASPKPPPKDSDLHSDSTKRCPVLGRPKNRVRSSSAGRNPEKGLRARYWAFLFENLYRAVDEIYQTCEMDESIVESKEAIMMLENYCKEFQALIQWLNISKNYEVMSPPNRPTSLAWEVRKSLPSKGMLKSVFFDKLASGSSARRKLDVQSSLQSTGVQTENKAPKEGIKEVDSVSPVSAGTQSSRNSRSSSEKSSLQHSTHSHSAPEEIPVGNNQSEHYPAADSHHTSPTRHNHVELPSAEQCKDSVTNGVTCNSAPSVCPVNLQSSPSIVQSNDSDVVQEEAKSHSTDYVVETNPESKSVAVVNDTSCSTHANTIECHDPLIIKVCIERASTADKDDERRECNHKASDICLDTKDIKDKAEGQDHESSNVSKSAKVGGENNSSIEKSICFGSIDSEPSLNFIYSSSENGLIDSKPVCSDLNRSSLMPNPSVPDSTGDTVRETEQATDPTVATVKTCATTSGDDVLKFNCSVSPIAESVPVKDASLVSKETEAAACSDAIRPVNGITEKLDNPPETVHAEETVAKKKTEAVVQNVQKAEPSSILPKVKIQTSATVSSAKVAKGFTVSQNSIASKTYASKTSLSSSKQGSTLSSASSRLFRTTRGESKVSSSQCSSEKTPLRSVAASGNERTRFRTSTASRVQNPVERSIPSRSSIVGSRVIQKSRPSQHHLGRELAQMQAKTGSSSSINTNSSLGNQGDQISERGGKALLHPENSEDSDGWETVKGRTRCKNSPAKKISASSEAVAAKLSQTKMGGFPYTCMSNKQTVKPAAKPSPPKESSSTSASKGTSDSKMKKQDDKLPRSKPSSRVTSGSSSNISSRKAAKEDVKKMEPVKKTALKQEQKTVKDAKSKAAAQTKQSTASEKTEVFSNTDKKLVKTSTAGKHQQQSSAASKSLKPSTDSKFILRKAYSTGSAFDRSKKRPSEKQSSSSSETLQVASEATGDLKSEGQKLVKSSFDSEKSKMSGKVSSDSELLAKASALKVDADLSVEQKVLTDTAQCCSALEPADTSPIPECQDKSCFNEECQNEAHALEMYERMMRKETQEHVCQLGLSWGDQMDLLDMELRTPGRALQIHEKLSSPFRKRTLAETIRLQEEKQLKAQEQRERFLEEKAQRFKDIQKKVEEMKALNEKKAEQQRMILEQKLQRAEEKRKKELEKIIKKAHDEEEKVNEIAFINSLEAQNKRHDLISKEKDHEARLQDIQGERQRKLEEKAAKEAAAEERRKVLEAERQARLIEMQEKRKQRDLKIEQQFLEKEKERQELANQKARDRELRLSALNAAQQANAEELQKKIQLKQEESARRHEENIEQIRQKAFELSVRRYSSNNDDAPQLVPYEKKKICTICNVLIGSEVYLLSHLRGKKHQEMINDRHQGHDPSTEELEQYNLKHIVDASADQIDPNIALDKERQKALKKRCKKLRQRMASKGSEFKASFESMQGSITTVHKSKMQKFLADIKKYQSCEVNDLMDNGTVCSMERMLIDVEQFLEKCALNDKVDFCTIGGVDALTDLLIKISPVVMNNNSVVPSKVAIQACRTAESAIRNCFESCIYILLSNKIGIILDVLIHRLKALIPDNFTQMVACSSSLSSGKALPVDDIAGQLMCFLAIVLDYLSKKRTDDSCLWNAVQKFLGENHEENFQQRLNDITSYIVSVGIIDRLSQYFNNVRETVNSLPDLATFLLHSMSFLMAVVKLTSEGYDSVFERKKTDDSSQLMATLKVTDLVGAVSLLYCILLHSGSPSFDETPPQRLPDHTVLVTLAALRMLNHAAVMNLHVVQGILGGEGISLQLRHISNYLLWYCSHWKSCDLLHEIIMLIGYFTVLNADNQLMIQSGQQPTVLKQLCDLPFHYFSDSKLTDMLFPTLISCCFSNDRNKQVLQHEVSIELLCNYLERYLLDSYTGSQTKNDPNIRWRLPSRFPKSRWTSAKIYFAKSS